MKFGRGPGEPPERVSSDELLVKFLLDTVAEYIWDLLWPKSGMREPSPQSGVLLASLSIRIISIFWNRQSYSLASRKSIFTLKFTSERVYLLAGLLAIIMHPL